jgi:MOSC domain-containing protein YiiM
MYEKPVWEGDVVALYVAPTATEPMRPLQEANFVEGRGIEGDRRYFLGEAVSDDEEPAHEVTLIESEAIESLHAETKVPVSAEALRRHIVTRGFSVNHLVDREFQVGEVKLRGLSLYEPSPQLMETVGHKVAVSMMHRGGLVAQILSGGVVRVGDLIHE